uniref:RNA-directed DNA polymerase, eukaryota n=1 Tax=Tanacetum cinerariifolium TaxID=118510 RepID=A0A6L2LD49_TANCI|nr:RNA-directed DNA polymerase, eukaryota [Tanacetum cinerariifolium]
MPQKPNSSIPRGPNHFTPKETNMENSKKSFVSVLKRGSQSHVTPEITKLALVLDETCIKEFNFGMSLMGRVKDVSSIHNLPCIISKEGFQNVKLSYLGGMWVLFEFDSLALKEKFLNHFGIGSWFTELIQADSSFKNEERIVWISIEGLPIKAWTPNTFCKITSLSNDQDDPSFDGESQEGNVANKGDNNESDVDRVSKSSFMHENNTAHKDVNIYKNEEVGSHLEDLFNIYGILDGQKNNVCNSCSDEPKFPPGFTPDNNVQEKNVEENIKGSSVGCSGGILCMWNHNMFVKEQVSTCDYFVALMGTWALTSSKLLIVSVYAPQELTERRDVWDYLHMLIDRWEGDTVIMVTLTKFVRNMKEDYAFTWAHKSTSKMSKLDRYLISEGVLDLFPHLSALCLDRHLSDHRPILLRETNYDYGPSPFYLIRLKKKLQALKIAIKAWSKEANKRSNDRKINIQQNLSEVDKLIDQGKSNDEILIKRITLFNDLQELNNRNAMEISQKAKIRWFVEGDENSKYFHDQVQDLERNVTYEVVKRAVWDCGTNKSPGPDGFSFEFYCKYWTTIDEDVFQAVRDFFVNGHFPRGCNSSFIALISKIQDAEFVKDFRPISLIGSVYKIIAKILANRLCVVLPYLISDVQSTFVANRQIVDGPFILNELLSWCKIKKLNGMISAAFLIECSILTARFNYLGVKNFFYGVDGSDRKLAWIGWNMVLTSKNGGLGVSSFFAPNRARLFKMPIGAVEQENYGLLCSKVADLVLLNISDRWCWSLEGSQEFLVKSSHILIDNTI